MFNKIKSGISKAKARVMAMASSATNTMTERAHVALDGTRAEAYVDTGVKILIAVVVGALLLAGLYALFNDTVLPTVTEKVADLFDYAG